MLTSIEREVKTVDDEELRVKMTAENRWTRNKKKKLQAN